MFSKCSVSGRPAQNSFREHLSVGITPPRDVVGEPLRITSVGRLPLLWSAVWGTVRRGTGLWHRVFSTRVAQFLTRSARRRSRSSEPGRVAHSLRTRGASSGAIAALPPAQLSLALLYDHFNEPAIVLDCYQQFTMRVVSGLEGSWRLTTEEIEDAVATIRGTGRGQPL